MIVRVARKVEPSRQKYIFPLPDLDGQGNSHPHPSSVRLRPSCFCVHSNHTSAAAGVGDTPVSLFDKCLRARKLHTAILYLPLIEAHYVAASPALNTNTNRSAYVYTHIFDTHSTHILPS